MSYTFTTAETVTKAGIVITGMQVSFAGLQSAATVVFSYVDGNGNQIPGTKASEVLPPSDFVSLWNSSGGLTLAALYSYLAGKLGLAAGTATGDGTLK